MVYKQLRNKVLADDFRVIKGEYKNNQWSGCAYAMFKGDWINGYKLRKDQHVVDAKDITAVVETAQDYTIAREGKTFTDKSMTLVEFKNKNRECVIQKKFLDLLKVLYPNAGARLAGELSHQLSPVRFYKGDELVAVIMPVRMN